MRLPITWPDGKTAAASLSFDFDAETVWVGFDADNAQRPGVLSIGHYGARVGLPLILDILARQGVKATFFVVGQNVERYADLIQRIAKDGHEIGVHGYTHTSPQSLNRDREEAELIRTLELLRALKINPTGYRSPSWDVSPDTLNLLVASGLSYSSQFMADIQPYWHDGLDLLELPIQWLLDDWPFFAFGRGEMGRQIADPAAVRSIWMQEYEGIRALGGHCIITMHPQVIGRPSRLVMLETIISDISQQADVWLAPCGEIAAYCRSELDRSQTVKLQGLVP